MTETRPSYAPRFFFACCQVGAEAALKHEIARLHPQLRFAYSRPGFLTFKDAGDAPLPDDFRPASIFARAWGRSLGKATGDIEAMAAQAVQTLNRVGADCLHVWPRDLAAPGRRGYEPGCDERSAAASKAIQAASNDHALPQRDATNNEWVADCIVVAEDEWWLGVHRAGDDIRTRTPGGLQDLEPPTGLVSRAGLKMEAALRWSGLPLKSGDLVAELGCSPGGAAQVLLARGMHVIGVDPATVDAAVAEHPRFEHIRKRAHEVRRREFRKVRWLTADVNAAPNYTLDAVEAIVAREDVAIRGLLLTIKLLDWKLADDASQHLERVRNWGFAHVSAAQLQHHRQEYCIAALRKPPSDKLRTQRGKRSREAVKRKDLRKRLPGF